MRAEEAGEKGARRCARQRRQTKGFGEARNLADLKEGLMVDWRCRKASNRRGESS